MHAPHRTLNPAFSQTLISHVPTPPSPACRGTVRTTRVLQIGGTTAEHGSVTAMPERRFVSTQRYTQVLPGHQDCIPYEIGAEHDRDEWRDVTDTFDEAEARAFAFARTLPAIERVDLEQEISGVHRIDRPLALRLNRHDVPARRSAPTSPVDPTAQTQRMKARTSSPLQHARYLWRHQSPVVAVAAATAMCVLSAWALTWLSP